MRALYICGSINQTRMMHRVARQLPHFEAYFTPYYCDGFIKRVWRAGVVIAFGDHRFSSDPEPAGFRRSAKHGGRNRKRAGWLSGWLRAPVVQIYTVTQGLDPLVMSEVAGDQR